MKRQQDKMNSGTSTAGSFFVQFYNELLKSVQRFVLFFTIGLLFYAQCSIIITVKKKGWE